jgi:UDP-N-acetylmuramoylalanine--D-glutamate ligase
MNYCDYFAGKKVTVMGLGLLGRGVGDVQFLAENGADLMVTDLKTAEQLAPSLKKLSKYKNIKYVLGKHRLEDFRDCDFVLKAGGVPLDSPFIAEAKKYNIPIEMSESLFAKYARGVTIVGVTGTRGKSTVTQLVYEILRAALRLRSGHLKKQVFLGGNIKGVSTLALLKKAKGGDTVVMELDSWRLQGFGESKISPHISVITNFMDDHMNYYKGDYEQYFADKANIYRFQDKSDFLVTNSVTAKLIGEKQFPANGKMVKINSGTLPRTWKLKLPGKHNRENVAYAVAMARLMGVKDAIIKRVVCEFRGLPGRLELVGEARGVKYVNDTNGTTPDAVVAALEALGDTKKRNLILICGGTDKKLDYGLMVRAIKKYAKNVVLFSGSAEKVLAPMFEKQKIQFSVANSMKGAVKLAQAIAAKGDTVLLSPGASSFGLFANEYDRGEQFNREVEKLK